MLSCEISIHLLPVTNESWELQRCKKNKKSIGKGVRAGCLTILRDPKKQLSKVQGQFVSVQQLGRRLAEDCMDGSSGGQERLYLGS